MPKNMRAVNPEERLQASVARDLKLRHLEEHAKRQAEAISAAKWESTLQAKDELSNKKRMESRIIEDSKIAKISNTAIRRQRLEELYHFDELQYEQELNAKGLAFRRERL
jgi:hypothetical protein